MEAVMRLFGETLVELIAAVVIAVYSLGLLSKHKPTIRYYVYRKLNQEIDEILVRLCWPKDFFRLPIKILQIWWEIKRGSLLGWGDITVSLGVFSLAIPGIRDVVIRLIVYFLLPEAS
jgi:hypothetical protein